MAYAQLDPRWKSKRLGFSTNLIGGYGCTITSLGNLLNRVFGLDETPAAVNDRLKAVKGFSGAYILWAKIPEAYPQLHFTWRAYNYDNVKVAYYVYIKKMPVLVEVNNGGTRHWVLYIGNRQLIDPLDGKTYPTSKYPLTTGFALIDRS